MRVLVVSDIHLGSPSRFLDSDKRLIQLLKQDCWDRVVFLGDLFDLWISPFSEITKQHRDVLLFINSLENVVYLPGNHDSEFVGLDRLNNMAVIGPHYVYEDNGVKVGFLHGNQYDPAERLGPVSRIVVWLGAAIDKLVQMLLGKGYSVQRQIRCSAANVVAVKEVADKAAIRAVEDLGTDIVIVGHFHTPRGPETIGNSIYINSGDFGPEHMSWVEIHDGVPKVSWQG